MSLEFLAEVLPYHYLLQLKSNPTALQSLVKGSNRKQAVDPWTIGWNPRAVSIYAAGFGGLFCWPRKFTTCCLFFRSMLVCRADVGVLASFTTKINMMQWTV